MDNFFLIIAIIISGGVLAYAILNNIQYRKILRKVKSNEKLEEKELYFELKTRMQLIVSIFSISAVVAAYFGFTTEESINKSIDTQVRNSFAYHDSILQVSRNDHKTLKQSYDTLRKSYIILKNEFNHFQNFVKNNSIAGAYIVTNNTIKTGEILKIYYKNLITDKGAKLPSINKRPLVSLSGDDSKHITLENVAIDYIEIQADGYEGPNGEKEKTLSFDILIFIPQ